MRRKYRGSQRPLASVAISRFPIVGDHVHYADDPLPVAGQGVFAGDGFAPHGAGIRRVLAIAFRVVLVVQLVGVQIRVVTESMGLRASPFRGFWSLRLGLHGP